MKEEKLRKIILCKGPEAEGSTEYASRREEKRGGEGRKEGRGGFSPGLGPAALKHRPRVGRKIPELI